MSKFPIIIHHFKNLLCPLVFSLLIVGTHQVWAIALSPRDHLSQVEKQAIDVEGQKISIGHKTKTNSINQVSLKQKIGQMIIMGFEGKTVDADHPIVKAILAQKIGGVILFDYNYKTETFDKNIHNPKQLKELTNKLQNFAKIAAKKHHNQLYPLWISIDYEGGERGTRLKEAHHFPVTLPPGELSKLSEKKVEVHAQTMAKVLQNAGINLNFAPVLDININPDSPAIGKLKRSFSHDPAQVVKYAQIFSNAYLHHGIGCAYKHFPGHGSASGDTHEGFVDVRQSWNPIELQPYEQLLNKKNSCPMVMVAHVIHSEALPATLSPFVIQTLLRKKLDFNGVVVTDDMQMKAITDHFGLAEALRLTINAGSDLLVFGNQLVSIPENPEKLIEIIYQYVKSGKISANRIHDAYSRVMHIKRMQAHNAFQN